jgi:predicted nucleic acid-binding protein
VRFVDTNVLLYVAGSLPAEREKAEIARQLIKQEDLGLSVQVLQEFYTQATRRTRSDRVTHERAVLWVEAFALFPVQEMTLPLLRAALETSDRFWISYWDAAIVEAARALGCRTVLSEDLQDGQDYGGIRVTNPFRKGRQK